MNGRLCWTAMILPFACANAAQQEEWREYKRSDQLVVALNVGDAKRTGSIVEVAMLLVPKVQPLAPVLTYTIMDVRADCEARTAQISGSQNYAGEVPTGERTPADAAASPSEGEALDPFCNLAKLEAPGAPSALDFARLVWKSR